MKKIKEFFDKKQNDFKFKNVGTGHKLSESSNVPSSSNANRNSQNVIRSSETRRTGPDANVANAALARFDEKHTNKTTTKSTLHDIMADEKRKITDENKYKDELEVYCNRLLITQCPLTFHSLFAGA